MAANDVDGLPPSGDLVSANNHRNEKLNEMSTVDCEPSEDEEEIEDDWFLKLSSGKNGGARAFPTANNDSSDLGVNQIKIQLPCEENLDFKEKTMKTLRVGLRKIWKRGSATITVEDPTYKVAYLGNVLTGWAKGEGCIEKPLNSLWKNYSESSKPDVQMKITVTQSGLKAVTKEHGLIEYWSHRITYCTVGPGLPRVFCWIYRHEGRKLKQELRCHAVLCSKDSVAARMATTLKLRLTQALLEFKKSKLLRQNARLSLANAVYDHPSLPKRKILLSTGCHNYKPPLERSKSAPKLMSIEESLEEEENTPRANRKFSEAGEEIDGTCLIREGENRSRRTNVENKCEYKLANLNFVKKLCSSIENLVESTSNYSKKFFTERKSSKDLLYLSMKKSETFLLKKRVEEESEEMSEPPKLRKMVAFDVIRPNLGDSNECSELKNHIPDGEKVTKSALEITLEMRDEESDEGSHSLRSTSSCCSDVSSLATLSTDKSADLPSNSLEGEHPMLEHKTNSLRDCETPTERLQTYLRNCNEAFLKKVVLHPTGHHEGKSTFGEEEEEEEELAFGHDDTSDGYLELAENIIKKLSLDRKEKDLPYHKIIKSTVLSQRRLPSSCLQI